MRQRGRSCEEARGALLVVQGYGCREEGIGVLGGGLTIAQLYSQFAACAAVVADFLGGWPGRGVVFGATVVVGATALDPRRDYVLYWIREGFESLGSAGLPIFRDYVG